ncbi:MAG: hypothetical protein PHI12_12255 [Dehalococcoidales bacterium]|nr:hypothetical protein [Dehalococcoidales bacterium]
MAFTLVAWSESQDTGGVLSNVAAVPDQHVTTEDDDVLVPSFAPNLAGVFAIGATISGAQISSPTLRKALLYDISPLNVGAEPVVRPYLHDRFTNPIALTPGEGLRALVSEGAAGAEQESVFVWLQSEFEDIPAGEILTVKTTSTTTLTAYQWSLCKMDFTQQLEAGTYAVVGVKAISAGAIAARLVMPGSEFRPGVIAGDAEGDVSVNAQRYGAHGVFGTFEHTFPPQVEFFSSSADTSETVYMDLIKL